ncbi:hypothetical protein CGRA01v4_09633 [Colletotrichum graminicola]|nr:hypothetical protein CGRA01v4_09633 [Colletotrichum graminicola]
MLHPPWPCPSVPLPYPSRRARVAFPDGFQLPSSDSDCHNIQRKQAEEKYQKSSKRLARATLALVRRLALVACMHQPVRPVVPLFLHQGPSPDSAALLCHNPSWLSYGLLPQFPPACQAPWPPCHDGVKAQRDESLEARSGCTQARESDTRLRKRRSVGLVPPQAKARADAHPPGKLIAASTLLQLST